MWIFMVVGFIPFIVVFGIVIFNIVRSIINYNKNKDMIKEMVMDVKDRMVTKANICEYCGANVNGDVCSSCGAKITRK